MTTPAIPKSAQHLPQQLITEVISIPSCPRDIEVYSICEATSKLPAKPSANADYMCQLEWSWSPAHERVSAYYLHRGRSRWFFWSRCYDDNWGVWGWSCDASVPRKGVSQRQAAIHLLKAVWMQEKEVDTLDGIHWINEANLLSVSDIKSIARDVWG